MLQKPRIHPVCGSGKLNGTLATEDLQQSASRLIWLLASIGNRECEQTPDLFGILQGFLFPGSYFSIWIFDSRSLQHDLHLHMIACFLPITSIESWDFITWLCYIGTFFTPITFSDGSRGMYLVCWSSCVVLTDPVTRVRMSPDTTRRTWIIADISRGITWIKPDYI